MQRQTNVRKVIRVKEGGWGRRGCRFFNLNNFFPSISCVGFFCRRWGGGGGVGGLGLLHECFFLLMAGNSCEGRYVIFIFSITMHASFWKFSLAR